MLRRSGRGWSGGHVRAFGGEGLKVEGEGSGEAAQLWSI